MLRELDQVFGWAGVQRLSDLQQYSHAVTTRTATQSVHRSFPYVWMGRLGLTMSSSMASGGN